MKEYRVAYWNNTPSTEKFEVLVTPNNLKEAERVRGYIMDRGWDNAVIQVREVSEWEEV